MKDLKNYSTEELIDMLEKLEEELTLRNSVMLPEPGDIFIEEFDESTITLVRIEDIDEYGPCIVKVSLSPEEQCIFVDDSEHYDIEDILALEKIPEEQKQEYTDKINKIIERHNDYLIDIRKSNNAAYLDCIKIFNSEEESVEEISTEENSTEEKSTTDGVE